MPSFHTIHLRPSTRFALLALTIFGTFALFLHSLGFLSYNALTPNTSVPQYHNVWNYTPPVTTHHPRTEYKACFTTFVRNDHLQLARLRLTMRNLEDSFNRRDRYPYIIFSDQDLSDEFKELASAITRATVRFEKIPKEMFGYPPFVDQEKAAKAREDMKSTIFGDSEDYRFLARFMAGTIFQHPALEEYDYYWRFETGTEYLCPMAYDPFKLMYDHNKKISFSMALYEYEETIPSLWNTTLDYIQKHPGSVQVNKPGGLWKFITDADGSFNRCHFWSNFEIGSLEFFRGENYQSFFKHIDMSGGFFYERWGDPIIHTLAAVLFLDKKDIHHWEDIGYRVNQNFMHCPNDRTLWSKCPCRPEENFDWNGYSCLRFFLAA